MTRPLPHAHEHPRSFSHLTHALSRNFLSLTKPKGRMYKTKSLGHYITGALMLLLEFWDTSQKTVFELTRKIWRIKTQNNLRNLFPPWILKMQFFLPIRINDKSSSWKKIWFWTYLNYTNKWRAEYFFCKYGIVLYLVNYQCNIMAEGFRFMPLGLVRLSTFRLGTWVR